MSVSSPSPGTAQPLKDTWPVLEQDRWQRSKERCEWPLAPGGIQKGAGNGSQNGAGYGLCLTLINQGVVNRQSPVMLYHTHRLGSLYNLEVPR